MTRKKIVYLEIALSKFKAIKKVIEERYGKERADKFSEHISKNIAELKKFWNWEFLCEKSMVLIAIIICFL